MKKTKCFSCKHLVDWMDEFGDRWLECELLNVPFKKNILNLKMEVAEQNYESINRFQYDSICDNIANHIRYWI